jgi:hypothetical protein
VNYACGLKDRKIKVRFLNEKYNQWWNEDILKISTGDQYKFMHFINIWLNFQLVKDSQYFVELFVWWCLTPISTIFQLYRGSQFYWWRKPGGPGENTDLSQVTDKLLSHNVVHLALIEIRTHNISAGLYNATKSLASYFCKMQVINLYW